MSRTMRTTGKERTDPADCSDKPFDAHCPTLTSLAIDTQDSIVEHTNVLFVSLQFSAIHSISSSSFVLTGTETPPELKLINA